MIFLPEERSFLLLYLADNKEETILNIELMKGYLQQDEESLRMLADNVITKLKSMSEPAFDQLDIFDEFLEGIDL